MNNEFTARMSYEQLRQIIFDYFKEHDNLDVGSASIEIFKAKLTGDERMSANGFFVMKNELGESRFDVSKEDIEKILKDYLNKKNLELINVKYDYFVNIAYRVNNLSLADDNDEEQNKTTNSIMKM